MRTRFGWSVLLALAAVTGCTRPRTQLVVAVDTDMTWGPTGALRAVQITVRSNDPEGQLRDRRVVELGDATPLPASFGVVPLDDDPSRRVWIEVRGCGESGCDAPLVTRQAYVGFVEGQTLLLQMTLAGVCRRVECPDATQTCLPSTGSCGSAQVEASTLSAWTGQLPRIDAGKAMDVEALDVTDGGESADASPGDATDGDEVSDVPDNDAADVGATEDRPSIDAADVGSGDGAVDAPQPIDVGADVGCAATCGGSCVDLQSDPNHCGDCDRACTTSRANSIGACVTGSCVVRCAEGYGDCDANPANGCEVDLRASAAHCGSCGSACAARPSATAVCVDGACGFTCSTGAADCDGDATNGCEATLATNAAHCGACGRACSVANATAACVGGMCAVGACASGFGDCDGDAANGCERGLTTDAANCGACGRVCSPTNATGACVAGACRVGTCATGFGDCDGDPANGCERDLRSDTANCGMCGRACAAGTVCVSTRCVGTIVQWSLGDDYLCVVRSTGEVECLGANAFGQLGDGTIVSRNVLTTVVTLSDAVEVSCGNSHTCARVRNGSVRCWGNNSEGQLGNDTNVSSSTPVAVYGLNDAAQISVGSGRFGCARRTTGNVVCWGRNNNGQLGDGTQTDRWTPTGVSGLSGVTSVEVGPSHACALNSSGVLCWGSNSAGQLGLGSYSSGEYRATPVRASVSGARQISAFFSPTCVRRDDSTVACWGPNQDGSLGIGQTYGALWATGSPTTLSSLSGIEEIQTGRNFGCARRATGSVFCWGSNDVGQCGNGAALGGDYNEDPVAVVGLSGTSRIFVGGSTAIAIMLDGSVVSWGANFGQMSSSVGGASSRFTPVVLR